VTAQSGTAKPFPERCLRGLRDKNHIEQDPNGTTVWILGKAFEPNWKTREDRTSKRRKSDHYESSINWEDHAAKSFQKLCEDRKNAEHGILSIRLADLEKAKQVNPLASGSLDWERDEIRGNPFHGNLLFSGNLPKTIVRELAAVIATHVQDKLSFIEPVNYESELAARATQTEAANKSEHLGFLRRVLASVLDWFRL
jgi:hypothetical protein